MSGIFGPRIPLPSIPKRPPGPLEKFIEILGAVIRKIGRNKPQNRDSTVEDISNIVKILEEYKEQVHSEAIKIEERVMAEVAYYVEELNSLFSQNADLLRAYQIRGQRIESRIQRTLKSMRGGIDHTTSKMISLDNAECRKILQMIPGNKKEQAMKEFMQDSIQNALNQYCKEFREELAELFADVEDEILAAVDFAGKEAAKQAEIMEMINQDHQIEKVQEILFNAGGILALCSLADRWLEVG